MMDLNFGKILTDGWVFLGWIILAKTNKLLVYFLVIHCKFSL